MSRKMLVVAASVEPRSQREEISCVCVFVCIFVLPNACYGEYHTPSG
jgi:hypothetical protein